MARSGNYLAIVVQLNAPGKCRRLLPVPMSRWSSSSTARTAMSDSSRMVGVTTNLRSRRAARSAGLGRSPPGTAGSQDARRDQRGHPVGHRHHSTRSTRSGRGWPLVGPGAPIAPPGTATCGAVSASPRRMIGSTRSLLAHVSDTRSLISGSRSWSAVSASAPVGVDVERINCTSRTGFAASTLFSTASCSARRSRYSRTTCRGAHCAAAGGQPTRKGSYRELGGRAFRNCELLRFPIDYVTQAVSDVSTEPRIARARPLGCPLSRRLHR